MTLRNAKKKAAPRASKPAATRAVDAPRAVDGATAVPARSEGHRLLMCVPASLTSIAAVANTSKQAVSFWRTGRKVPGAAARAALEAAYGIPAASWGDQPTAGPASSSTPSTAPEEAATRSATSSPTTMEGVEALLKVIRHDRGRPGLLAGERVKLADAETRLLALRHRLEKEAELLEDRIVKQHPMWSRIKSAIADTLVRWPEAARAVAAVLRDIEGEP